MIDELFGYTHPVRGKESRLIPEFIALIADKICLDYKRKLGYKWNVPCKDFVIKILILITSSYFSKVRYTID